ncbi:GNAT family N-acetyltransferase [Nocardia sp. NPDC051570]|uniref:GNAT family N-acetyltransferase n=1 Tax=Nocardia sp. NPDC051570 TaxID=3364324 RepID=UPI0037B9CC81
MRIRLGTPEDAPAVLALGDETVAWLNASGNTEQWGTTPWTANERRKSTIRTRAVNDLRVLIDDTDSIVGALAISETRQPYAPPADERELYVNLLLTARRHRGLGRALIDHAKREAAERGIDLLRVDCYAGGDGKLVRVYENYGFTRVTEFSVGAWPGMLLALHLSAIGQMGDTKVRAVPDVPGTQGF